MISLIIFIIHLYLTEFTESCQGRFYIFQAKQCIYWELCTLYLAQAKKNSRDKIILIQAFYLINTSYFKYQYQLLTKEAFFSTDKKQTALISSGEKMFLWQIFLRVKTYRFMPGTSITFPKPIWLDCSIVSVTQVLASKPKLLHLGIYGCQT